MTQLLRINRIQTCVNFTINCVNFTVTEYLIFSKIIRNPAPEGEGGYWKEYYSVKVQNKDSDLTSSENRFRYYTLYIYFIFE